MNPLLCLVAEYILVNTIKCFRCGIDRDVKIVQIKRLNYAAIMSSKNENYAKPL